MANLPRRVTETGMLAFRVLAIGLMLISGLGAVTFIALAVFQLIKPGVLTNIPVAMNLFAGGMGALMCYVGWRGQKIRSRLDIDKDIAELKGRRDRLQDWINR
jgi:hypothetical protein